MQKSVLYPSYNCLAKSVFCFDFDWNCLIKTEFYKYVFSVSGGYCLAKDFISVKDYKLELATKCHSWGYFS